MRPFSSAADYARDIMRKIGPTKTRPRTQLYIIHIGSYFPGDFILSILQSRQFFSPKHGASRLGGRYAICMNPFVVDMFIIVQITISHYV